MTAEVAVAFRDRETWRAYEVGDVFEGTDERVAELRASGLLAPVADEPSDSPDLGALTVAELRALCEGRGIDVPRRATKPRLLEILGD